MPLRAHLDTANARPRTVPVRSSLAGVKTLEILHATSTEGRAAGGDRPRSGGSAKKMRDADEIGQLQARSKLIAESRRTEKLKEPFTKQLLQVAIVSRFRFPAPVERDPGTQRQWFDKRFQVVTAETVGALPSATAE